jgi:hypothetical protein
MATSALRQKAQQQTFSITPILHHQEWFNKQMKRRPIDEDPFM